MARRETAELLDANVRTVRGYQAAFRASDLDEVFAFCTDDVEIVEVSSLPYGGRWKGREEIERMLGILFECWEVGERDFDQAFSDTAVSNDAVYVYGNLNLRSRKTGRDCRQPFIEIYRFRGGRIREIEVIYSDTSEVLAVLDGTAAGVSGAGADAPR